MTEKKRREPSIDELGWHDPERNEMERRAWLMEALRPFARLWKTANRLELDTFGVSLRFTQGTPTGAVRSLRATRTE